MPPLLREMTSICLLNYQKWNRDQSLISKIEMFWLDWKPIEMYFTTNRFRLLLNGVVSEAMTSGYVLSYRWRHSFVSQWSERQRIFLTLVSYQTRYENYIQESWLSTRERNVWSIFVVLFNRRFVRFCNTFI